MAQPQKPHPGRLMPVPDKPKLPAPSPIKFMLQPLRWNIDVDFSDNANFEQHAVSGVLVRMNPDFEPKTSGTALWAGVKPQSRYKMAKYTYKVEIKNGKFTASEQYENQSRYFITTEMNKLSVVRWDNLNDDGNESNTFTIVFCFSDPLATFDPVHQLFGEFKKLSRWTLPQWLSRHHQMAQLVSNPKTETGETIDPDLLFLDDSMGKIAAASLCRCVRIRIHDYKSVNNSANDFDPNSLAAIENLKSLTIANITPDKYCKIHRDAVTAESEQAMGELSKLKKTKEEVWARVVPLPGFRDRFALEFTLPRGAKPWAVPALSRAVLNPTDDVTSFFGKNDPGRTPGVDPRQARKWQGATYLKDKKIHMSIDNFLSQDQVNSLNIGLTTDQNNNIRWVQNFDLTFKEDADEPIVSRLTLGLTHLEVVLATQMGYTNVNQDPTIQTDYRQHLPNIFLHGSTDRSLDRPTKNDNLEQYLQNPVWQFTDSSQREAVRNVFIGLRGRTIIEGPPATGKTTVVAKTLCLLRQLSPEKTPTIVVTAHTNEAVRVTCARYLSLCKTLLNMKNPAHDVVLVISRNMLNYWRTIGKGVDNELMDTTIDAHLERLANRDPNSYAIFKRGCESVRKYGRVERFAKEEYSLYNSQREELVQKLKKSNKIWFATLSTLHLRHYMFGIKGESSVIQGVKADYLFVDEASQATDPYLAMAVLCTNPRMIVFAGDANQLSPFATTTEGQNAWGNSIFQRLFGTTGKQRLKMQYRTQQNMYAGTNAHYNNEVSTYETVADRERGKRILDVFKNIAYMGYQQKEYTYLSNNIHVLDILNGECVTTDTGTSKNEVELAAIKGLFICLRQAGVPPEFILFLTAYQGQYDEVSGQTDDFRGAALRKIDSSQGDEAEIVLYSMVRRTENGIGFLTDTRRQNVGTSRAREAAIYFLDFDMIWHEPSARSWKIWYNGLLKHPKNKTLYHSLPGPVAWFYKGKYTNVQTAGSSPLVFPSNKSDPTRSSSPAPRSRAMSGPGSQMPAPQASPTSVGPGSPTGSSRPRADSKSTLRQALGHSRESSGAGSQFPFPTITEAIGPARPATPTSQHARKASGQQPGTPPPAQHARKTSTAQSVQGDHSRISSTSKPMSPTQQGVTSPQRGSESIDPGTIRNNIYIQSLGSTDPSVQPNASALLLKADDPKAGSPAARLDVVKNDLPKWEKISSHAFAIMNNYVNSIGGVNRPAMQEYFNYCQKESFNTGLLPRPDDEFNKLAKLTGNEVAVATMVAAVTKQNLTRCETLVDLLPSVMVKTMMKV